MNDSTPPDTTPSLVLDALAYLATAEQVQAVAPSAERAAEITALRPLREHLAHGAPLDLDNLGADTLALLSALDRVGQSSLGEPAAQEVRAAVDPAAVADILARSEAIAQSDRQTTLVEPQRSAAETADLDAGGTSEASLRAHLARARLAMAVLGRRRATKSIIAEIAGAVDRGAQANDGPVGKGRPRSGTHEADMTPPTSPTKGGILLGVATIASQSIIGIEQLAAAMLDTGLYSTDIGTNAVLSRRRDGDVETLILPTELLGQVLELVAFLDMTFNKRSGAAIRLWLAIDTVPVLPSPAVVRPIEITRLLETLASRQRHASHAVILSHSAFRSWLDIHRRIRLQAEPSFTEVDVPGADTAWVMSTASTASAAPETTRPAAGQASQDSTPLLTRPDRPAAARTSDWTSPREEGWQAAASLLNQEPDAQTQAGLPKRVPKTHLVPGSAAPKAPGGPPSAEATRRAAANRHDAGLAETREASGTGERHNR